MRSHRIAALFGALATFAIVAFALSGPLAGGTPKLSLGQVRSEAREEAREIQAPSEAMLQRHLFGSDVIPSDAYPKALSRSRAIGRSTRRARPRAAATSWQFVGPDSVGGRILDIALDNEDPNTVFAAAAGGGVMKSTDGGKRFNAAWPADETQNIGALVMSPKGMLYAGTGETGPGGGSLTYGGTGLYRSADKGASWSRIGLEKSSRIGRIVLDPSNEKRIFVAVSGPLYKEGGERGLYRSEDGGATWKLVLKGDNARTGAVDLAIDPKNPKRMLAANWEHLRQPDQRTYSGVGSGIYRSEDGGDTWTRLTQFGQNPAMGRIGLAIDPQNPDIAYATGSGGVGGYFGFYKTLDFGDTWTPIANESLAVSAFTYAWWFGRVWVDPRNTQRVFVAGVSLSQSNDGGETWGSGGAGTHADHHAMMFDTRVKGRVWNGNDGGVYRSDDDGSSWKKAVYEPYSQPYSVDVSEKNPARIVTGLQDNGVNRNYPSGRWNEFHGGDGEAARINPQNENNVYACHQYGACSVHQDGGTSGTDISNSYVSSRHNWFTPIEFDPVNGNTAYIAGEIVSRTDDAGESFTPISPDLTGGPGRETNPLFKDYGTVTTISPAPKATGTIYAGTDDGRLWYTHGSTGDGALPTVWTQADDTDLPTAWVTRVQVHPKDPQTAYVTYSGFRTGEDAAYLFETTDGGVSWTNITGDLPRAPLNDVNVIDGKIVVGSEVGVFFTEDRGKHWYRAGKGLPMAPVMELRWHAPSKTLYAATFGRSIWKVAAGGLSIPTPDEPPVVVAPVAPPVIKAGLGALPRKRSCRGSRVLSLRVRGLRGTDLDRAEVFVGARRVARLNERTLTRRLRLRLPAKRVTLRVVAVTETGEKLRASRTYAACRRR